MILLPLIFGTVVHLLTSDAVYQSSVMNIKLFWQSGCVSVFPNAAGGFTLLAEAPDPDAAEELCRRAEGLM